MAKESLTINGRVYKAREFDFDFMCALEESGIRLQDIGEKIFTTVRCYVAYCMGTDLSVAGAEINEHIVNGGTFDEFVEVFKEKADTSGFFRAITNQTGEKKTSKSNAKKKAEVSE